ncbi:sensor histidine kinase [Paenibacillus cellulositrophicus]|uniref:cache domain-containing sensor histidine kinase n=1 Tax=Paenibacillus cellulositrophicus TaxID=562959 RepID=UPI002041B187|nr:sensor histidine kinase [Paenibacillus cellulositrophicus]MCM3000521.1 sensor histidine kinase [Paenibacillus cellulositrophicus]
MIRSFLRLASSLRNRMILIFLAITIVPFILFSAYAHTKSVEGIQQANATFSMSYLEQSKINLEAYLAKLNDQMNELIGDKKLQDLLEQPPASSQDEVSASVDLLNIVYQKKKQMDALQLRVYPLNSEAYPTYLRALEVTTSTRNEDWFQNAANSTLPIWHLSMDGGPNRGPLLSYVKTFTSLHNRTPRGLVVADLADNHFSRFFSPTKRLQGQKFLIVDETGKIVYDSAASEWTGEQLPSPKLLAMRNVRKEGVETLSIYDEKNLIAFVRMDSLPWTIVSLTPMHALTEPITAMQRLLIFFLIAYMLCAVGVVIYLTRNFTQPVFQLVRLMRKLEEGDFSMLIPHQNRKDEIGWLYRGFGSIVRKIEDLILQSTRAERTKRELEFQVLSHQINPHFLYNTLESIRWKAENHGRNDIGEMVSALGNLLRLSLNQGKDITTVGREVEQVKAYVQIEQARIGMPLRVLYFFDEEMLDMTFMRLLLQPLVENAIQHSIRGNFEKGKVILSGRVEERDLVIDISDNGKGIPEEVLKELNDTAGNRKMAGRSGVGLRNVNERLKIYFGPDYQLQIETQEGKGTKITIRHPILPPGGEERTTPERGADQEVS